MKKFSLLFLAILLASLTLANAQTPLCQWAQKIAGSNQATSIAVAPSGNVYVAGFFNSSTLSFNEGVSLNNTDSNAVHNDAYIAKYNSSGKCQWAQKIAGIDNDNAYSIAVDAIGNIYVVGDFFSDTLSFNNGILLINNGYPYRDEAYIAKYNSSGECQWAQKIAGAGSDETNSIAVDASGNVYVAGYFDSDTLSFNNGISLTNNGGYEAYIAKYNASGECQWAQKIAGTASANSTTVDVSGNVYVAGNFSSATLTFNNGISLTNSNSASDAYIVKYNSNGECQWAQKMAGQNADLAYSIAMDASGDIYVSGSFQSPTFSFNNNISLANSGGPDAYIAKYNASGECQWAQKMAGKNYDFPNSIAVDANGNVYVAGWFDSPTLSFNNGISLTNSGSDDAFFAKYNSNGANSVSEAPNAKLNIYPNPTSGAATITYNANANSSAKLMLMDVKGSLIKTIDLGVLQIGENSATISTDGLASGVYTIIINTGNETITGFITVAK